MIGLNGYTISTGIVSADLNGDNIVAVPLDVDDDMTVGYITHKDLQLTQQAKLYIRELVKVIQAYDVDVNL